MQWFKHDSDASVDAKLRRLRLKYGMEGYGLYWYCIELVARNVTAKNLTFELEHDAELIAADTCIHYERVQEMMTYMCDLGLFEQRAGVVTCLKLAERLDQSMTSNPAMRQMIAKIRDRHDTIMTKSDKVMQEEKRIEEKRKTIVPSAPSRFDEIWKAYPCKRNKQKAIKAWKSRRLDAKADAILEDIRTRRTQDEQWKKGFVPHLTTYINGSRWEDELAPAKQSSTDSLDDWAARFGITRKDGESDESLRKRAVTSEYAGGRRRPA